METLSKLQEDPQNYKTTGVAARVGDLVGLQQMVWSGRPVDVFDNRGWSPLHEAAAKGFSGCLEFMLRQPGVDPDWQTYVSETPILLAARYGHYQCLRALVNVRANINLVTKEGISPLFEAIMSQSNDCIRLLVKKGAVINHKMYTGYTPLHQAASMGSTVVVGYLLQQGAQAAVRCDDGLTPLFLAVQSGNIDTVKMLLNRSHDVDSPDNGIVNMAADDNATPLLIAAQEGHDDIVELLLNHGADTSIQVTQTRAGPLQYAIYCNHIKCVRKLLPATDVLMFDQDFGPMHPLVLVINKEEYREDTSLLEELLSAGISPHDTRPLDPEQASDLQDLTEGLVERDWKAGLLVHFSKEGSLAAAEFLLDRGMSPNALEEKEVPPLLAAMAHRNLPLFRLLLKRGADPNVYCSAQNVSMLYALHYDLQNSNLTSLLDQEEEEAAENGDNSGHVVDMQTDANDITATATPNSFAPATVTVTDTGDNASTTDTATTITTTTTTTTNNKKHEWLERGMKESFFMQLFAEGGETETLLNNPDTSEWGLWRVVSVNLGQQLSGGGPKMVAQRQGAATALLGLCLCMAHMVEGLHSDFASLVSVDQVKELNAIAERSGMLFHLCRLYLFRHLSHSKVGAVVGASKCRLPEHVVDYLRFSELEPYSRTLLALFTPLP